MTRSIPRKLTDCLSDLLSLGLRSYDFINPFEENKANDSSQAHQLAPKTSSRGIVRLIMTEVVEMLVCPQKGSDYELQKVLIESTPREDEILVRMVATGVCSTDFKTCD